MLKEIWDSRTMVHAVLLCKGALKIGRRAGRNPMATTVAVPTIPAIPAIPATPPPHCAQDLATSKIPL